MKQLGKVTYVVPSCREIRLEPGESIAQSSPLREILLTETEGHPEPANIGIDSLGYEDL